jgi:hypothetical protein
MTPNLAALLQLGVVQSNPFPANSRYANVATATMTASDGRTITYLRRRFVPQPSSLASVGEYTVVQGDRLDLLANQFFGDPELFWRICDGNGAVRPEELTDVEGAVLQVTLPEGTPGS